MIRSGSSSPPGLLPGHLSARGVLREVDNELRLVLGCRLQVVGLTVPSSPSSFRVRWCGVPGLCVGACSAASAARPCSVLVLGRGVVLRRYRPCLVSALLAKLSSSTRSRAPSRSASSASLAGGSFLSVGALPRPRVGRSPAAGRFVSCSPLVEALAPAADSCCRRHWRVRDRYGRLRSVPGACRGRATALRASR